MDIYDEIYWESLPKKQPIVAGRLHGCAARPETVASVVNVSSDSEEDGSSIIVREAPRAHGKFVDVVTIESDSSSASLDGHSSSPSPEYSLSPLPQHFVLIPVVSEKSEDGASAVSLSSESKMPAASQGPPSPPLLLAHVFEDQTADRVISGSSCLALFSHCAARCLIRLSAFEQGMQRVTNVHGMMATILALQMNTKSHA